MIVDTSAIVAIVLQEPGFERLMARLTQNAQPGIGAPTLTETSIVLSARLDIDARTLLARFLDEAGITVIPFWGGPLRRSRRGLAGFWKGPTSRAAQFWRLYELCGCEGR